MDNIRVAHRLPTLSGLSPTSSTAPTIGINSERNTSDLEPEGGEFSMPTTGEN
jgi:hypothetical protein